MKKVLNLSFNQYLWTILLVFLLAGCSSSEKEIKELLKLYQSSIINQNPSQFFTCFAQEYQDAFFPREKAEARIRQELTGNYPPSLELGSPEIQLRQNQGWVKHKFILRRIQQGKGKEDRGEEVLELRKGGRGWQIVSGSELYQILAGREEEEAEIKALLLKRVKVLAEKDLAGFQELVDPEYNFKGKDFSQLTQEMSQNFQDYDRIELILHPPKIRLFSQQAEVVEGFQLKIWYQGKLMEFQDQERLGLRKTPQGWKISKGL